MKTPLKTLTLLLVTLSAALTGSAETRGRPPEVVVTIQGDQARALYQLLTSQQAAQSPAGCSRTSIVVGRDLACLRESGELATHYVCRMTVDRHGQAKPYEFLDCTIQPSSAEDNPGIGVGN